MLGFAIKILRKPKRGAPVETSTVTIAVLTLTPVHDSDSLVALADVEMLIDGVSVILHGVQMLANGQLTEVRLPKYRSSDGNWRSAVTLPDDVRVPIAEVVMAAGIDAGILRKRAGCDHVMKYAMHDALGNSFPPP